MVERLGSNVHLTFLTHLLSLFPCSLCSSHLGKTTLVSTSGPWYSPFSLSGTLCPRSTEGGCSLPFLPLFTHHVHISSALNQPPPSPLPVTFYQSTLFFLSLSKINLLPALITHLLAVFTEKGCPPCIPLYLQ